MLCPDISLFGMTPFSKDFDRMYRSVVARHLSSRLGMASMDFASMSADQLREAMEVHFNNVLYLCFTGISADRLREAMKVHFNSVLHGCFPHDG